MRIIQEKFAVLFGGLMVGLASLASPVQALTEEQDYAAAWSLCQAGKLAESVEAFNKFLKRHPRGSLLPEAHFTLGRIEPNGNNSFAHYQFILDNHPAHHLASQAAYATAQYYQNVGALAEAASRYQWTYSRYPGTPAGSESLYRLTLLLLSSDSLDRATAYTKAFIEQYPSNYRGASLCRFLANHWRLKGDTTRANAYWRQILEQFPESYEAGEAREKMILGEADDLLGMDEGVSAPPSPLTDSAEQNRPSISKKTGGTASPAKGEFYLQVGVYRDQEVLSDWKKKLVRRNYVCRVENFGPSQNRSYRLLVGPYPDKASALKAAAFILQDLKIKTIMVQRLTATGITR